MEFIMKEDFINRKIDFQSFEKWVSQGSNRNKGIFIYAKSGVGKSRFITELFSRDFEEYKKIKVPVIGENTKEVESFSFLKRFYRYVINSTEKKKVLSLKDRITTDISVSVSYIAGINFTFHNKNGFSDEVASIMTYIKEKLRNSDRPYIIDFENFNSIDSESLECLIQLFQYNTIHRFIFEITIKTNNPIEEFYKTFESINPYLECEIYELKKLDLKDVLLLCQRTKVDLLSAKKLYSNSDGNLFPVIMLNYVNNQQSDSPTLDVIKDLKNDELILLYIIFFSQDEIHLSFLEEVFALGKEILIGSETFSLSYIKEICKHLEWKRLIKLNSDYISFYHDQIPPQLLMINKKPLYFLSGRLFENFHQIRLDKCPETIRYYHILSLLKYYTLCPSIDSVHILPLLKDIIIESNYEEILNSVKSIKENIRTDKGCLPFIERLTNFLIDYSISVGEFQFAFDEVCKNYSDDIPWQACYIAAVLSANPEKGDFEGTIIKLQKKYSYDLVTYLSISTSLLGYYMRTVPEKKVKKWGLPYLSKFNKCQDLNYAFFIKAYSNVLTNDEAIILLEQCREIFQKHDRNDLVAMNDITLASRYVYIGKMDDAIEILNRAEETVRKLNIPFRYYYFYNNRAAMSLLNGSFNQQTEMDLKTSEILAKSQFEKAIIMCNSMIYYLLINNKSEALKVFYRLNMIDLSPYNNIDLKMIVTKNRCFYYNQMGMYKEEITEKDNYRKLAESKEISTETKNFIMSYFSDSNIVSDNLLSKYPFHPDFIGYWQYEVHCDSPFSDGLY